MNVRDVSKLPQWAQLKIQVLERTVDNLKQSLAEVPQSRIRWGCNFHGSSGYVPENKEVRFFLDPEKPHRWIEVRLTKSDGLQVYGNDQLMVHLNSSNHLHLNTDEKGVY